MLAIHIDASYIFMEPMKDCTSAQMIETEQEIVNRMKEAKLGLKKQYLNNEASAEYKESDKNNGMEYKLVAPGIHRCNITERSIQTVKDHFEAIIAGVDDTFPMNLWCRLLEQTELQLNLPQQSNIAMYQPTPICTAHTISCKSHLHH